MARSNIAKRPDGAWRARVRDDAGRQHARHFRKKADAERWLVEQKAKLDRGEWADPQAGKQTLGAYAKRWEVIQVGSAGTRRITDNALRVHILPALGHHKIASIRRSDVQAFVRSLETKRIGSAKKGAKDPRTLSPGTVRNVYEVLQRVMDAAVGDRVISSTPCTRIALPKDHDDEVHVPTVEDVAAVRAELDERWRVIPTVLAGTGLRIGELLGLGVDDVDFLRRTFRVERQRTQAGEVGPLKSRSSRRTIPVGKVVTDALAAHLAEYPASSEALFTDERGEPLTYRRWKQLLRDAAKSAGVDVTSHSFRHFAASALISGGASVKQVQTFLGHSSAVITLRTYAHLWPGDEDRTRNVLDAALGPLSAVGDFLGTEAASEQ